MSYWTRRALLTGMAALALMLGAPAAHAQGQDQGQGQGQDQGQGNNAPGGRRGGRGGRQMLSPAIIERLGLSADQKTKEAKARADLRAAMEGTQGLAREDRRLAMQKAGEDYRTALNGILTPQQKTKLMALMAEARELRGLGPIGGQLIGLNPPLNADQTAKVKAIAAKYAPDMQALRGNGQGANPDARTQRRALMEKITGEVRAVLTPDQQSQLRTFGGRRGQRQQQQ